MNENPPDRIQYDQLRRLFEEVIPFNRFLGVKVVEISDGSASLEIPFRQNLVGNPLIKALHGGVISALLDSCGGVAVWSQIKAADMVATVDLRVDYLRPAGAEALIGTGRVVRLGNRVGVVELRAFQAGKGDEPIAAGMGVYNIRRGSGRGSAGAWQRLLRSDER